MKCKPYSEITVEIRTQLKTVKITLNIFAVYVHPLKFKNLKFYIDYCLKSGRDCSVDKSLKMFI